MYHKSIRSVRSQDTLEFFFPLLQHLYLSLIHILLQDGDVAKSRYAIERRDRTIHKRMRDYLYTIKNHPQLETTILPVGDGVAISIKMGESNERR